MYSSRFSRKTEAIGCVCVHTWTERLKIVVQPLSRVRLSATPWTAACQASLSITISLSLLKLMSIEWVMPSNHLIPCRPLLLPPSIFLSIKVFSNESALSIRCPKDWSFTFSFSPSNEYSGLFPLGWTGWLSLQLKGLHESSPTPQGCQMQKKIYKVDQ